MEPSVPSAINMNIHVNEIPPLIECGSVPANLANVPQDGSNLCPPFSTAPTLSAYGHPLEEIILVRNGLEDISPKPANKINTSKKGNKPKKPNASSAHQKTSPTNHGGASIVHSHMSCPFKYDVKEY